MTSEIAHLNKTKQAGEANQLMNNPLLREAFEAIEHKYIALAQSATLNDDDTRRNAVSASVIVKQVRQHLNSYIQTGVLADHELAIMTSKKKRSIFS